MKTLACELPELAANETRQRIQLYPGPGTYVHPVGGEFTLTTDDLAEFADDINVRGDRIALDYDHSPERGQGSRAAGWFVPGSARVEGDQTVTAEVDWTPNAASAIRDREYRFISPTFAPSAHRTASGQTIHEPKQVGAALTNRPFFAAMEPLAADDLPLEDTLAVEEAFGPVVADSLTTIEAGAARALIAAANAKSAGGRVLYADPGYRKDGKPRYPLTSSEEVQTAWKTLLRKQVAATYDRAQMSRIKARIRRAALKFGVTIGADETTKEKTMELTDALAADLGVAVDADDETVLAAMAKHMAEKKTLAGKVPADGTVTISAEDLSDLRASAATAKADREKALATRKTTALKGAISDGRIAASEEEFFAASFDRDPDGTEKFLADKPRVVTLTPHGHGLNVTVGEITVTADLTPVEINGVETPIDEDRARVAAAVDALMRKDGKTLSSVTADEYAGYVARAAADPNLALAL